MSSATTSGLLIRITSAACLLAAFLPFHGFAQYSGSGYFHGAPSDSVVSLLVEFDDPPMFVQPPGQITTYGPGYYREQFNRLLADVEQSIASSSRDNQNSRITGQSGLSQSDPQHDLFYKIWFGARITVPASMAEQVEALSYVRHVYPDEPVQAYITSSVKHIHADSVWRHHGSRGEGVTVGIIDSGIDYMHPALGGGFGPGFKVRGGHDFVDNDPDPMDLHGHGTHVAGIVAADGDGLYGVAPGADLYALRVLDADGRGRMSHILAAIEYSVDPDGDGDPSDHLDVVNMSLGSNNGSPNDPASVAVDNASALGVIFVVAAGNNGHTRDGSGPEAHYMLNGSQTIGSPGTARLAITVGATDLSDNLAPFSSKGPVNTTFALKPDVVAPGVNITSTMAGGGTRVLSGTSMAAPHVAGLAALMVSLHPERDAARIRSAITGSAKTLNMPAWHQGSGLIDPVKALVMQTSSEPSGLGFGMSDGFVSQWITSRTIRITNHGDASRNYEVSTGTLPPGAVISASQSVFSLGAGQSVDLEITLNVNNSQLAAVGGDIRTFSGHIQITGGSDTLTIPWSFSRAEILRLDFSRPGARSMLISDDAYLLSTITSKINQFHWVNPLRAEIYAHLPGNFAVATWFPNENAPTDVLLKNNISVAGPAVLVNLQHTDAIHPVTIAGTDHTGRQIDTYERSEKHLYVRFPQPWAVLDMPSPVREGPAFNLSTASADFMIYAGHTGIETGSDPVLVIPSFPPKNGIQSPHLFANSAAQMHEYVVQFRETTGISERDIIALTGFYAPGNDGDFKHSEHFNVIRVPVTKGFGRLRYIVADQLPGSMFNATYFIQGLETEPDLYRIDLETYPLTMWNGEMLTNLPHFIDITDVRYEPGDTVQFGISPVFPFMRTYFNSNGPGSVLFHPLVRGSLGEAKYQDTGSLKFRIYNAAGSVLMEGGFDDINPGMSVAAGPVRLEADISDHYLQNQKAFTRATVRADLSRTPANPPWVFSAVMTGGDSRPDEGFSHNEEVTLLFTAGSPQLMETDDVDASRTEISWRLFNTGQPWVPVSYTHTAPGTGGRNGTRFTATLTGATATDSSAVDIRFMVYDFDGNSSEILMSPAFAVGNWTGDTGTIVEPVDPDLPVRLALMQNYPNPFNPSTTIRFEIPESSNGSNRVRLHIYDITGRVVMTLIDQDLAAGSHNLVFDAGQLASGIYIYRLETGSGSLSRKMTLLK
jgi:subtilisin family serine protease